ncbi:MAG: ABC transporter permease [Devosia sp.]
MTIAPRWQKLIRDFITIRGRLGLMVVAIAVGIFGVTTIASSYAILTREVVRNYVEINPASAMIDVGAVDPSLLRAILSRPDIAAAEASSVVTARVEYRPGEWVQFLLFVIPDFKALSINKVLPQQGEWPPADGTVLLERVALEFLGAKIGDRIKVQLPSGPERSIKVSGTVHDPALAPAWQESMAYGYVTPATLAGLGGDPSLELVKIVVKDGLQDQAHVQRVATDVARSIRDMGTPIHEMRVPPTGRHPHQAQMEGVLQMFLVFAILTLILGSILTASMVGAWLAQQVRQIAVMKAIGGRALQIAEVYSVGTLVLATLAVAMGLPLGLLASRGFADVIAVLLNFDIHSYAVSGWLVLALVLGSLFVPLMFALVPIRRAVSMTVSDALSQAGTDKREFGSGRIDRLLAGISGLDRTLALAIRNTFRKRIRLFLTLGLIATAGGMFMTSLNIRSAWNGYMQIAAAGRNYDMEVRLYEPAPAAKTLALVASIAGVAKVEPWNRYPVGPGRDDGLQVLSSYPDGTHGSISLYALPAAGSLSHMKFLEGRDLPTGDTRSIVLNPNAWNLLGKPKTGDDVSIVVRGQLERLKLAGVVGQLLTPGAGYVSPSTYERLTGGSATVDAMRVVTDTHDATRIATVSRSIEQALEAAGLRVQWSFTETQYDAGVTGHVIILIVSLLIMSGLMAVVGLIGLASAQGTSVVERTREFGIMRTIGGTGAVIMRNMVAEGIFIGLLSVVAAIVLSLPLSWLIGDMVGRLAFNVPLSLSFSTSGLVIWIVIIVVGSTIASVVPALKAARLTIRETLAYV